MDATEPGAVMGTAGYMAPEQGRGRPADARSDVFAFGAVLYEMLTGQRAFDGASQVERAHAILTLELPDLAARGIRVPSAVERAMRRCLEKVPDERFQSTRDLVFALEALSGDSLERPRSRPREAEPASEARSIAVLPFANLSSDPEQEYFCDGMTEELITTLSRIRGLRVISRNSVMTLKGSRKAMREIRDLLKVSHVLEGSVRKAGHDVRIAAQLIDTATDGHLWAEHFSGTLDDVFDIQEKVARAITEALELQLSPVEQQGLAERPVSNARVLECCHRAHHEMLFCTRASLERAARLLQQGLDTLGEQPLLYVGLAQVHYWALESHLEPREEALGKAAGFIRHLENVDRSYTHALLAKHERFTGSQQAAIRHYEDALAADPGDVDSLWYLAWSYGLHAGKASAGLAAADRLVSIDPLTVANLLPRAASFWGDSDFARALAVLDDMLRREPDLQWVHGFRMQMLAKLGRVSEACRVGEQIVAGSALDVNAPIATALGHALLGRRDALLATVSGEFESFCWNDPE
ncbi:hypothetical protein EG835_05570, partial [bacterium]|nr:hypothetical protein [bacterium]